ncbi:unnamed protein product [Ophioblennius macclurei]
MKLLAVTLLLGALPALSNAYCYAKIVPPGVTQCIDDVDQTVHDVGSSWRNSKCLDCTCDGCCTAFGYPRNVPMHCTTYFDEEKCEYVVHVRGDKTVLCPHSAVGK